MKRGIRALRHRVFDDVLGVRLVRLIRLEEDNRWLFNVLGYELVPFERTKSA